MKVLPAIESEQAALVLQPLETRAAAGTSRERMLNALNFLPVDRPLVWLMRQAGRCLPEYRALREKHYLFAKLIRTPELAAAVTLQPIQRFGFDAAILFREHPGGAGGDGTGVPVRDPRGSGNGKPGAGFVGHPEAAGGGGVGPASLRGGSAEIDQTESGRADGAAGFCGFTMDAGQFHAGRGERKSNVTVQRIKNGETWKHLQI